MKQRTTTLIILAALAASACATQPPPAPDPTTDPDLQAAMEADHSGAAAGLLAAPAGRWLGAVILQMFQNVKLNIDIKLDNPQNPPPTTQKAKP